MKKTKLVFALALALPLLSATSSMADGFTGAGITYGMDNGGSLGFRGEYDISSMVERKPVSIVGYYKSASETFYGISAGTSALGFTANYDLSKELKVQNRQLHPFVGVGLERVTAEAVSPGIPGFIPAAKVSASKIDLSYSIGAKYTISNELDVSGSLDSFGGLTLGANYKF